MNQKEFIKEIVELAKEREINISQNVAKELLDVIETVIDNAILDGQAVKAFGVKFEQKKKEETTSGEVTRPDGTKVPWEKAPHTYPAVKYIKSKKDELTREI